jgi:RNA polymerase sigma-70 factor (ECF subfamily)
LLDSDADVEDALQESLLSVIAALPGFRSEATVLTYALRISVLQALSRRRVFGRRKHCHHELLRLESPLCPSFSPPDDETLSAGMRAALTRALDSIPSPQADAFVQRVALDRSPSEIAAEGGISVHTVRTRLRRALQSLRKQFDGDLRPALRRAR